MAYVIRRVDRQAGLAGVPVEMPLDILLWVAGSVGPAPPAEGGRFLFDPLVGTGRILGSFGWEQALRVLAPHIHAPHWSDDDFRELLARGVEELARTPWLFRAHHPPGRLRQAELVHVVADDELVEAWSETFDRLLSDLHRAQTRLLLLQLPKVDQAALELAERIVTAGGPAMAVLQETDPSHLDAYFATLYAHLVHSRDLRQVVDPDRLVDVDVHLFLGHGAEELLSFEPWLRALQRETAEMTAAVERGMRELEQAEELLERYTVEAAAEPRRRMAAVRREYGEIRGELEATEAAFSTAADLPWHHESEGAIPTSEGARRLGEVRSRAARASRELEGLAAPSESRGGGLGFAEPTAAAVPDDLTRSAVRAANWARREAERAPRVLNAGFRGAGASRPLVTRVEHVFEVDVGPRRLSEDNRASGDARFPVEALPPSADGHLLDVVLVSEQFDPVMSHGRIWLPAGGGRSAPVTADGSRGAPGPLGLSVTLSDAVAEQVERSDTPVPVGGRLAVYFDNNLLQSAALRYFATSPAGVDAGWKTSEPNDVSVDFTLSAGFREIAQRLRHRRLRMVGDEHSGDHRPAVNVALNDDGSGGHRLLVKHGFAGRGDAPGAGGPAPGWIPYDPVAGGELLQDARAALKRCFLDAAGQPAFDADNGKAKKPFLHDLIRLAHVGDRLRNMAFGHVRSSAGQGPADWADDLRSSLDRSRVIQVARTGPAHYVFPWALVYQHPLIDRDAARLCPVTHLWNDDGRMDASPSPRCPHADESWHRENIYCPYGFWGLQHVIEQPPSPLVRLDGAWQLQEVVDRVETGPVPTLSVAVTHALGPAGIRRRDQHLRALGRSGRLRLAPREPVADRQTVRAALGDAELVYFLCHGEYDEAVKEVYLGIGLRDADARHRLYPRQVQGWAETTAEPNLRRWRSRRPLVVVNGCHTTDLRPGELLNFVTAFTFAGASGVVGTEVNVLVELATEVAEVLFERWTAPDPVPVGQAIQEMRWSLAAKGNLVGLAYTPWCRADLRLDSASA